MKSYLIRAELEIKAESKEEAIEIAEAVKEHDTAISKMIGSRDVKVVPEYSTVTLIE